MWKYTSVITYVLLFRILLCQERIIAHVNCFGIYFIPTITFYKNNVRMITRTQTLFPYRRNLFQRKVINDDYDDDDDEISTSTNTIQEDVNVLKYGSAYGSSSDSGSGSSSSSSSSSSIGIGSGDIQVSASIELPFSVEIAFNAFQDPIRQPTWSSWLQSVEYVDPINSPNITKWTIRVMKFKFSWNAKHTRVDRDAGIIEWESESGVQNFGKVQFTPSSTSTSSTTRIYNNNNNSTLSSLSSTSTSTTMCLSMTITTPRIVQRLLGGKRQAIQHLIEEKMLRQTLERFRDVVLENDIPQQQQQQQQQQLLSNQQYQQQQMQHQQQHNHQIQHQNQHQQQTQAQKH